MTTPKTLFVRTAVAAILFAVAGSAAAQSTTYHVPYFLPVSDSGHEGLIRVVWRSCKDRPNLTIRGVDDTGEAYGPVEIPWRAGPHGCGQMVVFNSRDLENGNPEKGLHSGLGNGEGAWRLYIDSTAPVSVSVFVRTSDGLMTSMHDTVPFDESENAFFITTANPGHNTHQRTVVRLINPTDDPMVVAISGKDDVRVGSSDSRPVIRLEPRESRMLTIAELEEGRQEWIYGPWGHENGRLGNEWFENVGKWRLSLSDRVPESVDRTPLKKLVAMNLLTTPTGHITNLSTVPALTPNTPTVVGDFQLSLMFDSNVHSAVRASIRAAAKTWESIIVGDLADTVAYSSFDACNARREFGERMEIDDIVVFVKMREYGTTRPAASADTCLYHNDGIPLVGWLTVNEDYQDRWDSTTDVFDRTMVHELGHTLGFNRGSLDNNPHVRQSPKAFVGPLALAEWQNRGAESFFSLTGVRFPTDAIALDGVHFDSRMEGEIMMGGICAGSKVTPITVAVLADLGYVVDMSAAEDYPRSACELGAMNAASNRTQH